MLAPHEWGRCMSKLRGDGGFNATPKIVRCLCPGPVGTFGLSRKTGCVNAFRGR